MKASGKMLWQTQKLLVMSNFSICYNTFKSHLLQMPQKVYVNYDKIKGLISPNTLFARVRKEKIWLVTEKQVQI